MQQKTVIENETLPKRFPDRDEIIMADNVQQPGAQHDHLRKQPQLLSHWTQEQCGVQRVQREKPNNNRLMVSFIWIHSWTEIIVLVFHHLLFKTTDIRIRSHETIDLHPEIKLEHFPSHSQYLHERATITRLQK